MTIEEITSWFELSSYAVTLFGIPIAIYLFFHEKKMERIERESNVYGSLDEWYAEFLRLSLDNQDLGAIYYSKTLHGKEMPPPTTDEQRIRQVIYFEMLTSILERAFLIFKDQTNELKKRQWNGWNEYMKDWMRVTAFREHWAFTGTQFDQSFMDHMKNIRLEIEAEIAARNTGQQPTATIL